MAGKAWTPGADRWGSRPAAAEAPSTGEWEILEGIARGLPAACLLGGVVELIERRADDVACAILILDETEGALRHAAAARLPAELRGSFDGVLVSSGGASCSIAASRRERLIVEDIETHPHWVHYKQLHLAHGLHASWSNPILSPAGDVLGMLEIYCRHKRAPTIEECARVDVATHLASLALTRARAEDGHGRLLHDLGERVKELTLLHQTARLLSANPGDPRRQLTEIVHLLPGGWQHPHLCEARVVWGDVDVQTSGFRETPWKQSATGNAGEHPVRIEVVYLHLSPGAGEEPFLEEEQNLLQSLADLLGAHLHRYGTEQTLKRTLAELLDANQRLKFQANRMPLAYIVWDRHCVVTEWNAAAERIFGWTAAEAVGRHARELMMRAEGESASHSAAGDARHDDAAYTGGIHENVRKSGERLVCEWFHAQLRDATGQVSGHLSMANDITERKLAEEERSHLEAQLRQAQRIQSLGTLAGGIAHDFNNILTAIAGHAHLALLDLEEERSTKESLLAIQEAGLRAVEVVRRLLTFSRHRAPERKVGPLAPIAEQALRLLRATLPPSITIQSQLDPAAPDVQVDAAQVQQMLMNLGANAAYAMGERGVIHVSLETVLAKHIELPGAAESSSARYVKVSVTDTGCGMDSGTLERIFEPFFTTKPPGQSTGLGLSVVHGIVQSHEGLLSVRSKPGQGSVFHVYFPEAAAQDKDTSRELPREGAPGAGGRLLYVDDEEPLVVLAKRWLGRLGYQVTGFSDSSLALEMFRARPFDFDAVVSDFSMPGVSGLDLVREIMRIRPDIPVVMSSGFLRPEDRRLSQLAGAGDVVLKPHSMAEFAQVLHRTLIGKNAARRIGARVEQ